MKSVYIDVLITVNVFIDFILILCTKKALCINTSFKKMLLASLLGGVQSLIALFPPLPFFLNIPIDVLCAAGIVLCAFGKCPFKCFIKRISVFLSLSFSFCGIMMFLYNAFKPKGMEVYNDTVYCNLVEPFSGNYVIIAEQNIFDDYVPDETKTRIIPFESLGGNGIVKGFPPDKVKIDGKEICKSIYIGICNDVLKGDVKAIIPYELVKISE